MKIINSFFAFFITVLLFAQDRETANEIKLNFNQDISSNIYKINTDSSQFTSLSAFCLNAKIHEKLYYRIYNNHWGKWRQLKEDLKIKNEKRKVYGLVTIFEKFTKIQFKTDNRLQESIFIRLFIAKNDENETVLTNNSRTCEQPSFCDRACWCPSGDCTPQSSPTYIDVTHIIVHHSATNYSEGTDYKQVVYSYWDYHVNTHGWNDIGYNWLVDPNGIIYEGRGDSVQGAHFSCMNGNTMGVCVIGNFETAIPTTQSLEALENLIAWEATDKGIDVMTSSYHPPSQLNLQHISGHLDGNSATVGCPSGTLCPGMHLYNELPTIRNDIAGFNCYVANVKEQTIVQIYPNPVENILNINLLSNITIKQIYLYNSLGVKIKTHLSNNKIDFSEIKPGIYYLKIFYPSKTQCFTIIKK
jgi:hypothetical protein